MLIIACGLTTSIVIKPIISFLLRSSVVGIARVSGIGGFIVSGWCRREAGHEGVEVGLDGRQHLG